MINKNQSDGILRHGRISQVGNRIVSVEFLTARKIRQVGRPDGTENFDKSGKVICLTKIQSDEMNAIWGENQ